MHTLQRVPLTSCLAVFLVFAFTVITNGQQPVVAFRPEISVPAVNINLDSPPPALPPSTTEIINGFINTETRAREVLSQHTFKRDVLLQTIGPNGEVTGEYVRHSQFLFDDRGNRIERVLFHPPSTIWEMKITKEDIQDLAGAQLLGIDIVEATKYQLSVVGPELIAGRQTWAIDVSPLETPNPNRMRERFFVGRIWIDWHSLQVIKARGIVEPHGKQRFPRFETWRLALHNQLLFPSHTEADDILHFPNRDVHYRIKVRYYDYKRFASKVSVSALDEPAN